MELLEAFFRTHSYLIEHTNASVRRGLMDEINWNDRLIGIKGTRGVGKTTFLLSYAKERFGKDNRKCLYVNMNNFYFQGHVFSEFAGKFVAQGGEVLLLDQVFKLTDWSNELRKCYELFPELKIVFTGSSVMRLKTDYPAIRDILKFYNLRGFSFREYLNLMAGTHFQPYTFDEIVNNHEHIVKKILPYLSPSQYFKDYPILYAGPAKTPEGYPCGSMGPTTANRMDPYVDEFQAKGGSLVMIAKGNRTQTVTDACKKHGGFYLGSIGGPAAVLAAESIKKVEVLEYPELGMEAVWKIEVEDFPAFIVVDDKGNNFFEGLDKVVLTLKVPPKKS